MNNEKTMIIDIPFNTDTHPFWPEFDERYDVVKRESKTKEWINYRIDLFMKYTVPSLMYQTNQAYKCIVRYAKESEWLIAEALVRHQKLPKNIIFTTQGDRCIENLIKGYQYIYHIRIDSDNMFTQDYIEQLYHIERYEGLQCILSQKGYLYDVDVGRLADMYHISPSIYALVYKVEDFLSGVRYTLIDDHWGAYRLEKKIMLTHDYIITTHSKNIDNGFDRILKMRPPFVATRELYGEEKNDLLRILNLK